MENRNDELPQVLKDWKRAVAKLSIDDVMENYHDKAVFKGTLVNDLVKGADNIRPYFSDTFLKGKNNLACVFNELHLVYKKEGNSQQYVGKYTFTYQDDAGKQGSLHAHFAFYTKFDKEKGREVIKFHGSYPMPS